MLILEGSDNVGKTTAALLFQKKWTKYVLHHMGPPENANGVLAEHFNFFRDVPMIHDRFVFGRIVYGNILQRHRSMSVIQFYAVMDWIASQPHLVVMMYNGNEEEYRSRTDPEREMYASQTCRASNLIWGFPRVICEGYQNLEIQRMTNLRPWLGIERSFESSPDCVKILQWDIDECGYPDEKDIKAWRRLITKG